MRIGIDCRTILNPGLGEYAGIGHYTYFLVKHLLKIDKKNEYVLFFDYRMLDTEEFQRKNVRIYHFPFSQYKRFLPFTYSHMLIAAILLKERLDVFHAPANVVPLTYPKKSVITIHDLAIYKNPEWFPGQIVSTKLLVPQSLKKANHVIAVSESTKADLKEIFGVPAKKISVVHEAPFVTPINVKDRNVNVVKKFKLDQPFCLYVGTIEPRKNLENLIRAFTMVRDRLPLQHMQLILAGHRGYKHEAVLDLIRTERPAGAVRHIGYITHNEKIALLRKAACFVFPSYYEGFGLPVLEAMKMGVPVVTSNSSSLPEIGGRAALYVDPNSPKAIARAVARVLTNEPLRTAMVQRGYEQAKTFTWEKAAQETLAVYEKLGKRKAKKGKKKNAKKQKKEKVKSEEGRVKKEKKRKEEKKK